jgi:hypothetical protein
MFTNTKFLLSVAIMLGAASIAQAAAQHPTERPTGSIVQRRVPTSAYASDSVAPAPGQITRMTAEYFDPNPAMSRARSKHKSSLRRKRSLMSRRTGFITQISW